MGNGATGRRRTTGAEGTVVQVKGFERIRRVPMRARSLASPEERLRSG
jgi:hypothetical protein